ncbi:MAG: hypothetical protein AMXMBFR84_10290 [Candidatus Hydrogenedentota bacterium]
MLKTYGYTLVPILLLVASGCTKEPEIERKDIHGLTPFHQAARAGDLETVRTHLESGVSPNLRDQDGVTALHRAARDGHMELATLLLEYNADTNLKTNTNWTPLQLAAQYKHAPMMELLLRYNADPDAKTPDGRTPLHIVAAHKDAACANALLKEYTQWEVRRHEREDGSVDLETVTLGQRHADTSIRDAGGYTAFQRAVEKKTWDVVSALLRFDIDLNVADPDGRWPLHAIVAEAPEHVTLEALSKMPNLNQRDKDGLTPLQIANKRNSPYLIQMIYSNGGR